VRHANRGKTSRFDRRQIPTTAFNVEDIFLFADNIFLADFDRGVSAAIQH